MPAVQPRREPGLEEPPDVPDESWIDDLPLLLVQVVHEVDDAAPPHQRDEERNAVLHPDHDVRLSAPPAEQVQDSVQVHREPATSPAEMDLVADLVAEGPRVGGGTDRDLPPARHESHRDPLDEHLRAAAFRVTRVTPHQEDDAARSTSPVGEHPMTVTTRP